MIENSAFEMTNPAKVLIVDDEVLGAMGLESSLKRMGYNVIGVAVTGDEAVDIAGKKHPDIILMDISLQDETDGISAAEIINQRFNVPVIFLTARYRDNILKMALKSNPYGYLNKPVRSVEVKTAIETALHRHRMHETEKRMYLSEKKHCLSFEKIALGILYVSSDLVITDANYALYGITGIPADNIIGKDYCVLMENSVREDGSPYPPDLHPAACVFKTGKKERDTLGIFNREDNCWHWVIATAVAVDVPEGGRKISEAVLTLEDITERKDAEDRFIKAFEMLSVPVAIVDLKNRVMVDANRVFLNNIGYDRQEIVGKSLSLTKIFADGNEKRAFYDAIENNGRLLNMPVKALTSSGKIKCGYISAEMITIANNPQVLISFIEDMENFHVL